MRFFADTADIVEIRDLQNANLIQGVTTNPTLVQRAGRKDFTKCMEENFVFRNHAYSYW